MAALNVTNLVQSLESAQAPLAVQKKAIEKLRRLLDEEKDKRIVVDDQDKTPLSPLDLLLSRGLNHPRSVAISDAAAHALYSLVKNQKLDATTLLNSVLTLAQSLSSTTLQSSVSLVLRLHFERLALDQDLSEEPVNASCDVASMEDLQWRSHQHKSSPLLQLVISREDAIPILIQESCTWLLQLLNDQQEEEEEEDEETGLEEGWEMFMMLFGPFFSHLGSQAATWRSTRDERRERDGVDFQQQFADLQSVLVRASILNIQKESTRKFVANQLFRFFVPFLRYEGKAPTSERINRHILQIQELVDLAVILSSSPSHQPFQHFQSLLQQLTSLLFDLRFGWHHQEADDPSVTTDWSQSLVIDQLERLLNALPSLQYDVLTSLSLGLALQTSQTTTTDVQQTKLLQILTNIVRFHQNEWEKVHSTQHLSIIQTFVFPFLIFPVLTVLSNCESPDQIVHQKATRLLSLLSSFLERSPLDAPSKPTPNDDEEEEEARWFCPLVHDVHPAMRFLWATVDHLSGIVVEAEQDEEALDEKVSEWFERFLKSFDGKKKATKSISLELVDFVVVSFVLQSRLAETQQSALKVLESMIDSQSASESMKLVTVILYLLERLPSSKAKFQLQLLGSLSVIAKHPVNAPFALKIIQSLLQHNWRLCGTLLRLIISIWTHQPQKLFPVVSKTVEDCVSILERHALQQDALWRVEAKTAIALSIRDVCQSRPEKGVVFVRHLYSLLEIEAQGTRDDEVVPIAISIEALSLLCKNEEIDIRTLWKTVGPRLSKDKRPLVLRSLCELLGVGSSYCLPPSVQEDAKKEGEEEKPKTALELEEELDRAMSEEFNGIAINLLVKHLRLHADPLVRRAAYKAARAWAQKSVERVSVEFENDPEIVVGWLEAEPDEQVRSEIEHFINEYLVDELVLRRRTIELARNSQLSFHYPALYQDHLHLKLPQTVFSLLEAQKNPAASSALAEGVLFSFDRFLYNDQQHNKQQQMHRLSVKSKVTIKSGGFLLEQSKKMKQQLPEILRLSRVQDAHWLPRSTGLSAWCVFMRSHLLTLIDAEIYRQWKLLESRPVDQKPKKSRKGRPITMADEKAEVTEEEMMEVRAKAIHHIASETIEYLLSVQSQDDQPLHAKENCLFALAACAVALSTLNAHELIDRVSSSLFDCFGRYTGFYSSSSPDAVSSSSSASSGGTSFSQMLTEKQYHTLGCAAAMALGGLAQALDPSDSKRLEEIHQRLSEPLDMNHKAWKMYDIHDRMWLEFGLNLGLGLVGTSSSVATLPGLADRIALQLCEYVNRPATADGWGQWAAVTALCQIASHPLRGSRELLETTSAFVEGLITSSHGDEAKKKDQIKARSAAILGNVGLLIKKRQLSLITSQKLKEEFGEYQSRLFENSTNASLEEEEARFVGFGLFVQGLLVDGSNVAPSSVVASESRPIVLNAMEIDKAVKHLLSLIEGFSVEATVRSAVIGLATLLGSKTLLLQSCLVDPLSLQSLLSDPSYSFFLDDSFHVASGLSLLTNDQLSSTWAAPLLQILSLIASGSSVSEGKTEPSGQTSRVAALVMGMMSRPLHIPSTSLVTSANDLKALPRSSFVRSLLLSLHEAHSLTDSKTNKEKNVKDEQVESIVKLLAKCPPTKLPQIQWGAYLQRLLMQEHSSISKSSSSSSSEVQEEESQQKASSALRQAIFQMALSRLTTSPSSSGPSSSSSVDSSTLERFRDFEHVFVSGPLRSSARPQTAGGIQSIVSVFDYWMQAPHFLSLDASTQIFLVSHIDLFLFAFATQRSVLMLEEILQITRSFLVQKTSRNHGEALFEKTMEAVSRALSKSNNNNNNSSGSGSSKMSQGTESQVYLFVLESIASVPALFVETSSGFWRFDDQTVRLLDSLSKSMKQLPRPMLVERLAIVGSSTDEENVKTVFLTCKLFGSRDRVALRNCRSWCFSLVETGQDLHENEDRKTVQIGTLMARVITKSMAEEESGVEVMEESVRTRLVEETLEAMVLSENHMLSIRYFSLVLSAWLQPVTDSFLLGGLDEGGEAQEHLIETLLFSNLRLHLLRQKAPGAAARAADRLRTLTLVKGLSPAQRSLFRALHLTAQRLSLFSF